MRSVIFPPQSYHRNLSDLATGKGMSPSFTDKTDKNQGGMFDLIIFQYQLLGLLPSDFSSIADYHNAVAVFLNTALIIGLHRLQQ